MATSISGRPAPAPAKKSGEGGTAALLLAGLGAAGLGGWLLFRRHGGGVIGPGAPPGGLPASHQAAISAVSVRVLPGAAQGTVLMRAPVMLYLDSYAGSAISYWGFTGSQSTGVQNPHVETPLWLVAQVWGPRPDGKLGMDFRRHSSNPLQVYYGGQLVADMPGDGPSGTPGNIYCGVAGVTV